MVIAIATAKKKYIGFGIVLFVNYCLSQLGFRDASLITSHPQMPSFTVNPKISAGMVAMKRLLYRTIKAITAPISTRYAVQNLPNLVMLASILQSIYMCVLFANNVTLMQS